MAKRNKKTTQSKAAPVSTESAVPVEAPAEQTAQSTEAPAEQPAPAPAEQPAPAKAEVIRRNNFPQFMGKVLNHVGGNTPWPRHVLENGSRSEAIVRDNPGITFETYIASKGSVSRLCYMVQKGKVKLGVAEVQAAPAPVEAPVEEKGAEAAA